MKKECQLTILNLITGEEFTSDADRVPVNASQLLAETLPYIMPDAPDGFAALLECAGEPRFIYQCADVYGTKESATGYRVDGCEIVVSFQGCHYAAFAIVTDHNPQNTTSNDVTIRDAYTPEQNNRAMRALSGSYYRHEITGALRERAQQARLEYVANITEE
jgi:hypothetical protein